MDKNVSNLIDSFKNIRVLLLGEAMLDSYVKGTADRLAPEAPVPVVSVEEFLEHPGGAANTAVNLSSMGADVVFLSVIGTDSEGDQLTEKLAQNGIDVSHILRHSGRKTLMKRRVLAGTQLLLRYDQGSTQDISPELENRLLEEIEAYWDQVDAVILSDYRYGILTQRIIEGLENFHISNNKIIIADSKRLPAFKNLRLAAIKPNYYEAAQLLTLEKLENLQERADQVRSEGGRILDLLNTQIAAISLDHDGAFFFERGKPVYRTYAHPNPNNGVSGAGDTFISALALALAAHLPTEIAAEIASAAANIVVRKEGTSVCTAEELKAHFSGNEKRVDDPSSVAAQLSAYRSQGRKIVFTNGCFDILHSGHVSYLNQAKALGDVLILGLNSDESVQRLKGPDRPINHLDERARVLAALTCIDFIIPFYEDTPVELIRQIRPDIYVKGGDYTPETLPEAPVVQELGGEVRILPFVDGQSTTHVIDRIRTVYQSEGR